MFKSFFSLCNITCMVLLLAVPVINASQQHAGADTKAFKKAVRLLQAKSYGASKDALQTLLLETEDVRKSIVYSHELIHASFMDEDYDAVNVLAQEYKSLYLEEPGIDYVTYLQALSLYHKYHGSWGKTWSSGIHDIAPLEQAQVIVLDFVKKYPDSLYYGDVLMLYHDMQLDIAKHHFHVARYYRAKGAYLASQDRLIDLIHEGRDKTLVVHGLEMMEKNYRALSLFKDADLIKSIVDLNQHASK